MTDQERHELWTAAAHESMLCKDSFRRFENCGERQIASVMRGKPPTREENIAAYNAYADFLQHLCELYKALYQLERERGHVVASCSFLQWIRQEAHRLLQGRAAAIRNGTAPNWENAASLYDRVVPEEFGEDFCSIRNRTNHVKRERVNPALRSEIKLRDFYDKYHVPVIDSLYRQATSGYLEQQTVEADWSAIAGFSVLARNLVEEELRILFMASDGTIQGSYAQIWSSRNDLARWIGAGFVTHDPVSNTYTLTDLGDTVLKASSQGRK